MAKYDLQKGDVLTAISDCKGYLTPDVKYTIETVNLGGNTTSSSFDLVNNKNMIHRFTYQNAYKYFDMKPFETGNIDNTLGLRVDDVIMSTSSNRTIPLTVNKGYRVIRITRNSFTFSSDASVEKTIMNEYFSQYFTFRDQ